MSTDQTSDHTPNLQGLKRPFMLAYTVKDLPEGQEAVWSKIGAAWQHKDSQGFNISMDALPLDGRVVLRVPKDKDHSEGLLESSPA